MLLHMRNILTKGEELRFHETMNVGDLLQGQSEIADYGPLHVDLRAKAAAGAVEVSGRLDIELTLVCSRCLTHVKEKLEIPFFEMFVPKSNGAVQEADHDDDVHPVSEDKIDLTPYVQENVLLAVPFVPLCGEACKGLCPVCGQNRNETDCRCSQEKIDPRWAGLADLFDKDRST